MRLRQRGSCCRPLSRAGSCSAVEPAERFQFWHDTGSLVYRPVDVGGRADSKS